MALVLQLSEKAELSSRAFDVSEELSFLEDDSALLSTSTNTALKPHLRWSSQIRKSHGNDGVLQTKALVIAVTNEGHAICQHMIQEKQMRILGTVIVPTVIPKAAKADNLVSDGCTIYALGKEKEIGSEDLIFIDCLQAISGEYAHVWASTVFSHITADRVVCLDAQVSLVYGLRNSGADCLLKVLSGKNTDILISDTPQLEIPQYVTNVPAALLTLGEIYGRNVEIYVCVHNSGCGMAEKIKSFAPLLSALELDFGKYDRKYYVPEESMRSLYI